MKELAIETINLTKKFNKVLAVDDLNLKIPSGIIFGYLGPNGAGKSTTIKMLVNSLRPTAGTVNIFGEDVGKNKSTIFKNIGYVPEHPTYFTEMTGEKLLRYMGKLFNLPKIEIKTRISKLLKLVNLEDARKRYIGNYSAGMKQRIGIAQALINDPALLIMDEITSNLDPMGRAEMIELLKQLRKDGKTIFVSTHILPEVQRMNADSIGILNKGKLFAHGTINELKNLFGENLIKLRPKESRIIEELQALDFVQDVYEDPDYIIIRTDEREATWDAITQISRKHGFPILDFITSGTEIEDIFMKALGNNSKGGTAA